MTKFILFPVPKWLAMTDDAVRELACLKSAVHGLPSMAAEAVREGDFKKAHYARQLETALSANADAWRMLEDDRLLPAYRPNLHNRHVVSLRFGFIVHLVHYRIERERILISGFQYVRHSDAPPGFRLYPMLEDFNLVRLCPHIANNKAA